MVGGVGGHSGAGLRFQAVDLQKPTWTTGEQQAHVHVHHKTSTIILYIDIWTLSPCGSEREGLHYGETRTGGGRRGGRERRRRV